MKKLIILCFSIFLTVQAVAQVQSPKPPRIIKTDQTKNNICYLALFAIQDADDYLNEIKASKDLKKTKELLELVSESFSDYELFTTKCSCIASQQKVIWLLTDEPADKIEIALKSENMKQIHNLVDEISDDVFYMLLFTHKCFQ